VDANRGKADRRFDRGHVLVLTTSLRLATFEILDDALLLLSNDTDARCVLVMILYIFISFTDTLE